MKIEYDYDKYSDVLYISFGKPKKAISKELESGVIVRFDPFTSKCLGVTVVDFRETFCPADRLNIKGFINKKLPGILERAHFAHRVQ